MGAAPLSRTLALAACATADMAARAARLQDALSPLMARASAAEATAMQELDQLQQEAVALAAFGSALALACPNGWTLDPDALLAELPLRDLARRLGAPPPSAPAAVGGELDLF